MDSERSHIPLILAIVFGLLFVLSSIFGLWAFAGMQDYKNNVDEKIADASAVAVQQAETAKDAEFVEKEKSPIRSYKGPATYGTVTFSYPKTWSIYAEEAATGTVLDLYALKDVVPGVKNSQTFGLRVEIVSQSYDSEVKKFDSKVKNGEVTSTAFRPVLVPSVLGVRIDGTLEKDVQGSLVLLPLRDRTIKIYTEIPQYVGDFNNTILPSLTFVP